MYFLDPIATVNSVGTVTSRTGTMSSEPRQLTFLDATISPLTFDVAITKTSPVVLTLTNPSSLIVAIASALVPSVAVKDQVTSLLAPAGSGTALY